MVWTRSVEFGWWVLGIAGLHPHSLCKSRHTPIHFWAICWNLIREILLNLIDTDIKSLPLHQLHLKSWEIHLTSLSSTSHKLDWFLVGIEASNPPSIVDEDLVFYRTVLAVQFRFFNGHETFIVSTILISICFISWLRSYLLTEIGSIFRPHQSRVVSSLARLLARRLSYGMVL